MSRKNISNEEFIRRATEAHGGKYTYEHTHYVDTKTPIIVTCPEHGDYTVNNPRNHMKGFSPCPECNKMKPITTEVFITRATDVWGDKYDYSKVNYGGSRKEVTIICKEHNCEFTQMAYPHLMGVEGCPECKKEKAWDTDRFIMEAKKVHGDKYDYSQVEYVNNSTEVTIKCNECGTVFKQKPYVHIGQKCGCKHCNNVIARRMPIDKFVEMAKKVHGNRYDYTNARYVGSTTDIIINCPVHGEVIVNSAGHLGGCICHKCSEESRITTEVFVKRAREKHGDKYDYSQTEYVNSNTKVKVICKKCNRVFETWPLQHLKGVGCPYCTGRYKTTEDFIDEAKKVHGDKFDYSETKYVDSKTKVIIKCNDCGASFQQTPTDHLAGCGCPKCKRPNYALTFDEFVSKARDCHGDKYDYSRVK